MDNCHYSIKQYWFLHEIMKMNYDKITKYYDSTKLWEAGFSTYTQLQKSLNKGNNYLQLAVPYCWFAFLEKSISQHPLPICILSSLCQYLHNYSLSLNMDESCPTILLTGGVVFLVYESYQDNLFFQTETLTECL